MSKPKLLWISDAVVPTGFARVAHHLLHYLQGRWDISVLGINVTGDPHPSWPYPIYPAAIGGDMWGFGRYRALIDQIKPDVVGILQDPWVVSRFLQLRRDERMIAYMPLDAPNLAEATSLAGLELAVWMTFWAQAEARRSGYKGRSVVIPHGVDLLRYRPIDRDKAREHLGLDQTLYPDAYIVGNLNRNQPRKRLDLSVKYFADWVHRYDLPPSVYLYLHAGRKDVGVDFVQLAEYWGVADRLLVTSNELTAMHGVAEEEMPYIYSAFDVQINTGHGEGWGLPQMEGMACGVPQIVGQWSALAEWAKDAALLVPCTSIAVTSNGVNTIGGIPDADAFIAALQRCYRSEKERRDLRERGLALVRQPQYRWEAIAEAFHVAFSGVYEQPLRPSRQPALAAD